MTYIFPKGFKSGYSRSIRLAALACLIALTAGGCVYLRLLALKNQLADFDGHFAAEVGEEFVLRCKEPVIYGKDIVNLTELMPSAVIPEGARKTFVFHFQKTGDGGSAPGQDLIFRMGFNEEDKLDTVVFSGLILKIVPPEFLELSLRSLGHAEVDRKKRQVRADSSKWAREGLVAPARDSIAEHLGAPAESEWKDGREILTYRYRLSTPTAGEKAEEKSKAVMRLFFNPETGRLADMSGNFAGLKLSIHYQKMTQASES